MRELTPAGPVTAELWQEAAQIRSRIADLPFLKQLADGTLSPRVFVNYLQQDEFYLASYARALAMLATRSYGSESAEFWARSASEAVTAERVLHDDLFNDPHLSGLTRPDVASPTTRAYANFLLAACAFEPYPVAAAAVLPCYWVYAEVGAALAERAKTATDHPYAAWVSAYDDPEFREIAQRAINEVEAACAGLSETLRGKIKTVFLDATRYEELFWLSAMDCEQWQL
ncbi:TenA family protein [Dermabacteraceae bacterium TAE3-ERU27]|nr:TenA family protein [Dermabacteraceae bacterium TAE3-ERU27]